MTTPLLDANQAAELLNVKPGWVLEEARHDRIPHIRLGKYVRFDSDALVAWARNRTRGPAYYRETANSGPGDVAPPRGPTPDLTRRTDADQA
jgi:excisionase family DNA binding protein